MIVEVDGQRVRFEVNGVGEPLLLLHGWGGQIESFYPILTRLSEHFKIYVLDLPGFGDSDLPPAPWGSEDYARFVTRFMAELGVDRANVVGHSFGGRIAIRLAADFPKWVAQLVLVDSAGIRPRRGPNYYLRIALAKVGRRLLVGKLKQALFNRLGSTDYREAGAMQGTLVKTVNEDLRPLLAGIEAPTLLIWGERDEILSIRDAELMEREISDATLVILEDAGHFSYLDRPQAFYTTVLEFLGSGSP
ncbi:MAG: alpha/beta fold hydrolase [Candidatus Bipolaricaulia bacterium]